MTREQRIAALFEQTPEELINQLAGDVQGGLGLDANTAEESVDRFALTAFRRACSGGEGRTVQGVVTTLSDSDLRNELPQASGMSEGDRDVIAVASLHRARDLSAKFAQRTTPWYADSSGVGGEAMAAREERAKTQQKKAAAKEKVVEAIEDLASANLPADQEVCVIETKLTRCVQHLHRLAEARLVEKETGPATAAAALTQLCEVTKGVRKRSEALDAEVAAVNACIEVVNASDRLTADTDKRRQLVADLNAFNQAPNVRAVFSKRGKAIEEGVEVGLAFDPPNSKYPVGRFTTQATRVSNGRRGSVKRTSEILVRFETT